MKSRKGQATRAGLLILHQLGHIAMLLILLALIVFALLGFRFSRGPVEVPRLASWFATHMTGEGINVRVNSAELAWAGYHSGGNVPFILKLAGIEVRTQSGAVLSEVPAAVLSLPVVDIFGGRKPITLDGKGATFPDSDVPVSWYAKLWPGAGFTLTRSDVHVEIGAGRIGKGDNAVVLHHAGFVLSVLHDGSVQVADGQAQMAQSGDSAPKLTFSFQGQYHHRWQGLLDASVDKVWAQDLPFYWPTSLMPNTRHWITNHVTSGSAQNGHFTFGLSADENLSHFHMKCLSGQFSISDLSVIWLKDAPPLAHLNGLLTVPAPDTELITASGGDVGGIKVQNGSMKISGPSEKEQSGLLKAKLAGSVQNMLAVLAVPSLNILHHAPPEVSRATGMVEASLTADIPFKKDLKKNEIAIQAQAQLSQLWMPTAFTGLAFSNGEMTLSSNGHMFSGTARANLAGYPVDVAITQDLSKPDGYGEFTVRGGAGFALWRAAGLKLPYIDMQGEAPFTLKVRGTSSRQQADLSLDLTPVSLAVPIFGWTKQAGDPGRLNADFILHNQQIVTIQQIDIQAPALLITGQGTGNSLILQQARIGRNQISGTITRPAVRGMPWVVQGGGAVLDLRLKSLTGQAGKQISQPEATVKTRPWQVNLAFVKVYMAQSPALPLINARLTAVGNAGKVINANFVARGVNAVIGSSVDGRQRLSLQADDAGALLNALGVYKGINGGTLDLQAVFGNGPMQGILKLSDIRLLHAPGFIKIMQAATLYGVAEALSGPGLLLNHTSIPFTLTQDELYLHGADTYSEALGFTASGTISLVNDTCNLETTIIPAYALNSFLGRIPLIGHLFTAEKGGGLFAMRAHVHGKINDPEVSVNPISVFLPGFLRGIFGLGTPASQPAK